MDTLLTESVVFHLKVAACDQMSTTLHKDIWILRNLAMVRWNQ